MGQALYRKYRPKSLDDVVGQEHVTTTLRHAIKSGKISHAYLFTGPHGVGKTSVARILAHEVNGLKYDDDSNHLDIIEIDAASNRRIDEIRDLRDKVHISPTSAKYKVYIIDEVHMLTKEAFNALLKTLEEPPAHVIFILATTEAHKLPETIISRTQRYSFKPIELEQTIDYLKTLAKAEKIETEPAALQLIAEHGAGSFRDSISLLDQAGTTDNELTLGDVQRMLGIAPADAIDRLIFTLQSGTPKSLLVELAALREQGYQAASIARQLSQALRTRLLNGNPPLGPEALLVLLHRLIDVPASPSPEHLLEVILLRLVLDNTETVVAPMSAPVESLPEPPPEPEPLTEPEVKEPKAMSELEPAEQIKIAKPSTPLNDEFSTELWPVILEEVKKKHSTLYGVLRMSQPVFADGTLTLAFRFPFHQKQMKEAKNNQKLADIIQNHVKQSIKIDSVVKGDDIPVPTVAAAPKGTVVKDSGVDAISNIFGGAEVLES